MTSLREEGVTATMGEVVDVLARLAGERWGSGRAERQDVAWRHRPDDLAPFSRGAGPGRLVADGGLARPPAPVAQPVRLRSRLDAAGVGGGLDIRTQKPSWLRPKVRHGAS